MTDGFRLETQVAIEAVAQALELARAGVGEITFKGERDVVTTADVAVEAGIRATLTERLGHAVVGEEAGGETAAAYWLVDPICGTRNFASGIPLYCTNVALVEDGEVTVAVVGDPSGEIQVAERGRGTWVVDGGSPRRLSVTDESSTIVIEDSHNDPDPERRERAAAAVARAITAFRWDIRALSTSLVLPYVAAGRIAGYVLFWTTALHVAAGALLAAEAGATVSDVDGQPWTIESVSIVAAATPQLHRELLELA